MGNCCTNPDSVAIVVPTTTTATATAATITPELPTIRQSFLEQDYLPTSEPPAPKEPADKCANCKKTGAQKIAIPLKSAMNQFAHYFYCKTCGHLQEA